MSAIFGERLIFGQHEGPNIELKVWGDEFYARYETLGGYTVVYDLDQGMYCYAALHEGRFVSSGTPLSKPVPSGIQRHLKERPHIRNEKFKTSYQVIRPPLQPLSASSNVIRTSGPNSGLLTGRKVAQGNVRGLTILVEFDDIQISITRDDVDALLNQENYTQNGNYCSVRKYYQLMSSGKLDYTNKVVGPVRLSRRQSYYINNLLIPEALQLAIDNFNVDFSEFDSQGEGFVDAISFLYAGRTLYAGLLWPHNSIAEVTIGNYRTHFYTIQSLGRNRIDLSIGTFCHESGHMLCRFPDLYDYGERDGDFEASSGLGEYCLMSWGNHLDGGKRPSPICVYLRDLAGWCDQEVNLQNPGRYEARHGDYRTVMRFRTDKPHEYFLVENRNQEGLDKHLPDSGIAIYHCDTRGSNEFEDGTPDNHYQCALIQADGRFDLENNMNGGDDGDLYESVAGIALSDDTLPNSNEWDGTDSGLTLSDVGPLSNTIPFRVGEEIIGNIVDGSVVADLIIPDDDPSGVKSEIHISKAGSLLSIKVNVKITHTYRGDLKVQLKAPSGKAIVLHSTQGGQLHNLNLSLDSKDFAPLAELLGESIQGKWTLMVSDLFKDDVGRLDKWSITIEYKSLEQISKGEANPHLPIPDANSGGVQSAINITESGKLKGLSVEVDISHTYRGDLQIELIAPSSQRALLLSSNGDSNKNVHETYTEVSTNSLKALIGEEIQGEWRLHIRDLVAQDIGTLDRWAITIRR